MPPIEPTSPSASSFGNPPAALAHNNAQIDPLARLYATGVLCIATALTFFLTAVVKLPVLLYFPLSHRWSLVPNSDELSMDFFGRSLLAILGGAVAAAVTLAVFKVRSRLTGTPPNTPPNAPPNAPPKTSDHGAGLALLTGYAATAILLSAGVYAYQLYGRVPVPEPLPPGLGPIQQSPQTMPRLPRAIPKGPPADPAEALDP